MKNAIPYKIAIGCITTLFCYALPAQNGPSSSVELNTMETQKRTANYSKLKELGYQEKEIFEDLGNANFLLEKYETALFWYKKLKEQSKGGMLTASYQERYQFSLQKMGVQDISNSPTTTDWLAAVASDYKVKKEQTNNTSYTGKYGEYVFNPKSSLSTLEKLTQEENSIVEASNAEKNSHQNAYKTPVAITTDGQTAYFSKSDYVKPAYGIFSKKELVHKIYKADKVGGAWKNIQEVRLTPKNYSALHPTISDDGKRLFFASNMPGTFGKFDIYVAEIKTNGTIGIAKNLGKKVNTEKNDLYPNIVNGTSLFFASNGHKGYGGLDVYMVEVGPKKVGFAANLGSQVNSIEDDFSIDLMADEGTGYVMSNRGKGNVQKVAFTYTNSNRSAFKDFNSLEVFNEDAKTDYSTSIFEDK